jgi:para-aminobenzoate synthetase component 1
VEALLEPLADRPGTLLMHLGRPDDFSAGHTVIGWDPFLVLQARGTECVLRPAHGEASRTYGNPWYLLDALMARFEVLQVSGWPFPAGGCLGYWGFDLKHGVEPQLRPRARDDLELPDAWLGFYDRLLILDHDRNRTCIVSTGLAADATCSATLRQERLAEVRRHLAQWGNHPAAAPSAPPVRQYRELPAGMASSLAAAGFVAAVRRAQEYIRAGDIYQVNLAQRLSTRLAAGGWPFYQRLARVCPAPYQAFIQTGDFQLASCTPELFLELHGDQVRTRPIKGTRPRAADPVRDGHLAHELQTSEKENAELLMITDLLRNDLGRICAYGTVRVPELARLERYPHVQHLVASITGRLRPDVTHAGAVAACFPGGSITGAPKVRALEIIDELEPVTRGPYTGAWGYLGFNRRSHLNMTIRSAVLAAGSAHYHVGAGIVADSDPEAEYRETIAKAGGFIDALEPL